MQAPILQGRDGLSIWVTATIEGHSTKLTGKVTEGSAPEWGEPSGQNDLCGVGVGVIGVAT